VNPPAKPADHPPESRALVRRSIGWLLTGAGLAGASTAALIVLGNVRVPRIVGLLIALGFPAAAFSCAAGAWIFYRKVAARYRELLPVRMHALARTGLLIAGAIPILIALFTAFAAGSVK
jgi:hypothetical protein